jgi:hypothetical protein
MLISRTPLIMTGKNEKLNRRTDGQSRLNKSTMISSTSYKLCQVFKAGEENKSLALRSSRLVLLRVAWS